MKVSVAFAFGEILLSLGGETMVLTVQQANELAEMLSSAADSVGMGPVIDTREATKLMIPADEIDNEG